MVVFNLVPVGNFRYYMVIIGMGVLKVILLHLWWDRVNHSKCLQMHITRIRRLYASLFVFQLHIHIFPGYWYSFFLELQRIFPGLYGIYLKLPILSEVVPGVCIRFLFTTVSFSHEECHLFMIILFSDCNFAVAIKNGVCDLRRVLRNYYHNTQEHVFIKLFAEFYGL